MWWRWELLTEIAAAQHQENEEAQKEHLQQALPLMNRHHFLWLQQHQQELHVLFVAAPPARGVHARETTVSSTPSGPNGVGIKKHKEK